MSKTKRQVAAEEDAAFGAEFKRGTQALWAIMGQAVVRSAYHEEAIAWDKELSELGIKPHKRHALFAKMKMRRFALEAQVKAPDAYDRYRALAEMLGLLDEEPPATGGEVLTSPPSPSAGAEAP